MQVAVAGVLPDEAIQYVMGKLGQRQQGHRAIVHPFTLIASSAAFWPLVVFTNQTEALGIPAYLGGTVKTPTTGHIKVVGRA